VILGTLDETAALETLEDLANHNPLLAKSSEAERRSLYAETGGNPLLLRWTAGQLGRGSCRTIEDALEFLRRCPLGNDPLEFVFGDLVREFTPEETRVLVALTYFNLPTKVGHIATVANLRNEIADSSLRTLSNRSLVVSDQEEKAFSLVPMVADFLRRKCPEIVADTTDRLERRAHALIVENGFRQSDRFATLDEEWPTVAPALPLFIGGANARLQNICSALTFFLRSTLRWDEWLSLEEQGEARAVASNDYRSAGWRAFEAGYLYYYRRQADGALKAAERAGAHWQAAGAGPRERGTALRLRALAHQINRNYEAAINTHLQVLDLRRSDGAKDKDVVDSLCDLATAEMGLGDRSRAEQHSREALEMAIALDYSEAVASCHSFLAGLMLASEEWQEAEILARKALLRCEKVGPLQLIAVVKVRLADALMAQQKQTEALSHAQAALQLFEQLGVDEYIQIARATVARCEGKRY
jgi:tetratricopeptide (TPR) repeat protein